MSTPSHPLQNLALQNLALAQNARSLTRAHMHPPSHLPQNLALAQNVFRLAERKGCTPGQLALAWLLHKGGDVVPIPGVRLQAPGANAAAA